MISFDEWEKLDLRVGTIKAVKEHPDADKLYILLIDFKEGEPDVQLVAGLKEHYKEDELIGKKVIVLANLEHKEIRGVRSQGMVLAADDGTNPVSLLTIDKDVENNAKIR